MLSAPAIVTLHDAANLHGHDATHPAPLPGSAFLELVLAQHQANFDLWHEEDRARDPRATPQTIVEVKRAIDRLNQQRNDLAEQLDLALLEFLSAANSPQSENAPLHSETPGLIIDRLSILSLKLFHTEEQTHRADAAHRGRAAARLATLSRQRSDLAGCLTDLWSEVLSGHRRFQLYRQLKMYNDPALNPVLYTDQPPPAP